MESTLIHCRKKTEGTKRLKEVPFKKWQVYAWALLVFLDMETVQRSTWRGTDIKRRFGTDSKIHQYDSADGSKVKN